MRGKVRETPRRKLSLLMCRGPANLEIKMSTVDTADETEAQSTETTDAPGSDCDDCRMMTRRGAMKAGAVAVGTVAMASTGAVGEISGDETIDFSHDLAHDPLINGSITVANHKSDFDQLDYVNDSEVRTSLIDEGVVLASEPDSDTPHNPVTLKASNFEHKELNAFPRDLKYDSDGDGDIDSDDKGVFWHDPTHWSKDASGSAGTGSLTEVGDNKEIRVTTSSQTSGDVIAWTFDLSTVGSQDATITDGVSQKRLQLVADIDALQSAALVEIAIVDSNANEVTATIDGDGDASTTQVLASTTGDSKVLEVPVGDLESDQSVTLDDIQQVKIRVSDDNPDVTFHGVNLESSSEWVFGEEEFTNSDGDVDVREVTKPAGAFTVTGLPSIPAPLDTARIKNVQFDVELRASHLPEDQLHVRVNDSPDAYDRPKEVEMVPEFEWPSGYDLTVSAGSAEVDVEVPNSRYTGVEVATAINDIDEWSDIDDSISWTDKTGSMGSVDSTTELLASTAAGDRTGVRIRTIHSEDEATAVTSTSGGSAAVAASGGGGGFSIGGITIGLGLLTGVGIAFRKRLMGLLGA